MTLYDLKPRFQALLRPLVHRLARAGVTANTVTVLAALGSLAVAALVAWGSVHRAVFLLIPLWLGLRMALNAADGMLAREFGQKSRLGGYLNELGDVVSDAALYAPFALAAPFSAGGIGLVIVLSILTEFAGVLGPMAGTARRYEGPAGKSDRALVFGALGLWVGSGLPLPQWLGWLVPILSAALLLTIVNRVRAGLDECAEGGPPIARLPGRPMRQFEQKTFNTHDGVELIYRHWPAAGDVRRGAIVIFHRGHEHSGRMAHLADELDLPDFAIFAWDARGHGRSSGERGFSPSLGTSVRDVDGFIAHIAETFGIAVADIAVIAQSVGAVLVATWVHDYAPDIRAMVLASPAFQVKLYVPFARQGLALLQRLRGPFFVKSYVRPQFLTHDRARIASYRNDPLIARPIAVHILLALYATAKRVVADARAITVPTQLLISGADLVVHQAPQHRFFERLGAAIKERHVLPGFYHDTLGERDRAGAIARVRGFILARFAQPAARRPLRDADQLGFTRDEADALASPLPLFSLRGLRWRAMRLSIRLGGLVSQGLAVGRRTGFDSGSTLDYVYRNEPQGLGPVGRAIDRAYLDSIGWRGIRQRKLHLEELLRLAMQRLTDSGKPVRLVDIAAGHGRYILDALDGAPRPETILLRDYSDRNVEAGRALITARGLDLIASFTPGDAFDHDSLVAIAPQPTLAVISGLYELFADNALITRSLDGLAAAMPRGGLLVYTNQPWHPQLEMIARVLTSHRQGQPWIMRRRTQGEMDQLVEAAGFRKVAQRIDEWGIFTVSLAERVAP